MRLFKKRKNLKVIGINKIKNSKIIYGEVNGYNNSINISVKNPKNYVNVSICGNNNSVEVENLQNCGNLIIKIVGNDNKIVIGNDVKIVDSLSLYILENCNNAKISIGQDTSFWKTVLQTCDNNSSINIGNDCMFSYNTVLFNSDGHAIIQNDKLINKGDSLKIGNHVWVGYEAVILKNSIINDNSIVGYRAVVAGRYTGGGCVIAGVPAKIVKHNVNWSRKTPNEYTQSTQIGTVIEKNISI